MPRLNSITKAAFALMTVGYASSYTYDMNSFASAWGVSQSFNYRQIPQPPPYPPPDSEHDRVRLEDNTSKSTALRLSMTDNNPYAVLGLDSRNPPLEFDVIHKAYKMMAKKYHPDLILDPDCTEEERHLVNMNFARINAAYETLKANEAAEILEYHVYIDGNRVRRHVTINCDSYYRDPTRPNYDRIIAMSKYREKHPRKKLWFERKHEYDKPRHNGEWEP
eukprot:scaffold324_cov57-Cyclotella_meneghiniana.AAC.8